MDAEVHGSTPRPWNPDTAAARVGAMSRSAKHRQTHRTSWRRAGVAAALLAVAAVLAATGAGRSGAEGVPDDAPVSAGPTLGPDAAAVTLEYYSDFQCPFCGRLAAEVLPALVDEYVDSGEAQLRWRDFPALGDESLQAALAARAAHEQGRFWDYHDLLFEAQEHPNSGTFTRERLRALAVQLGLDVQAFDDSLDARRGAAAVEADFVSGQRRGVTGTPTIVINGRAVVGAQPLAVYQQVIDEELAAAR
jgi:protein-disulfide isomerase